MLTIAASECSCDKCSFMCHAPCCGTPLDMKNLIDAGYGKRLMLDNLPGGNDMLKPALKGYEGGISPWAVSSKEGCTFWANGKCELHALGLKPSQGKLANHSLTLEQTDEVADYIDETWSEDKGAEIIKQWESIQGIIE